MGWVLPGLLQGQRTPRSRNLGPALALGLLLTLSAAACGDDAATSGCKVDADCKGARTCEAGVCIEAATDNNATNNGPNNGTDNNNNTDNNGGECQQDLQCAPGTVCDLGSCGERQCQANVDCGQGRFCYASLCYPTISCTTDAQCDHFSGTCQGGSCVPGCVIRSDCPDPANQECVSNRCVESCQGDNDCGRGEICEGGFCQTAQCVGTGTNGCDPGTRCQAQRCVPFSACDADVDCASTEQCDNGICEARRTCVGDANCNADEQCIDGYCHVAATCTARADCDASQDCVGGQCVPYTCRGNDSCPDQQLCEAGDCVDPDPVAPASRVVILTPPQSIFPTEEITFQAVALDADNNILVGSSFSWASSNEAAATIDEAALAIGGNTAGVANITATLIGTAITSEPVALRNPGPPTADLDRVLVVDSRTGAAINGAVVNRGAESATTDASGVATFSHNAAAQTLSIFANGYNYLTIVATTASDVLAPLSPARGGSGIGGFKGGFDLSGAHTTGDITIGLAGASLDPELANLDLQTLLGDSFNTQINIPGIFQGAFPLPGGLVLYGTVFGFPLNLKNTYFARTPGGLKVGWSFGGLINGQDAIGLVGGGDAASILPTVLGFFEGFDHGVRPIDVTERPLVADSRDIDGDGNTTELVPDYDSFNSYEMAPNVRQRLRTSVQVGDFNQPDGAFAILVGGVVNQGIGFVPLGINVSQDDNGDGTPDLAQLKMAPPHSGLSAGDYQIVAITFDPGQVSAGLDSGIDLPDDISVVLWGGRSIPTDLTFNHAFLPIPTGQWAGPNRQFTGGGVADADFYRVTFVGDDASWDVWFPADGDGFVLPTPPEGYSDWSADSDVQLQGFLAQDGVTLDVLAGGGGASLDQVSSASRAFSRRLVAARLGN